MKTVLTILGGLAAAALAVIALAFGGAQQSSRQTSATVTMPSIEAELAVNYKSVDSLARNSTLIVEGTVTTAVPRPFEQLAFTQVTVVVDRSIKGTAAGPISVLETGGLLPPGTAKGNVRRATVPTDVAFNGVRVMQPGERYLLFLEPYRGPIASDSYVVLGVFQGKFPIDATGQIQVRTTTGTLPLPEFEVLSAVNGRSLVDVVAEVQASLR
jgi:hypothetical protein